MRTLANQLERWRREYHDMAFLGLPDADEVVVRVYSFREWQMGVISGKRARLTW